jgi:hypothetical protein
VFAFHCIENEINDLCYDQFELLNVFDHDNQCSFLNVLYICVYTVHCVVSFCQYYDPLTITSEDRNHSVIKISEMVLYFDVYFR